MPQGTLLDSSVITVSAALEDVHVAVSVSDEGRGISADRLPHLFKKFSRIRRDDSVSDTGLGLAICKGIVEAHGGRIRAESEGTGLGARFTFTLPIAEPDQGHLQDVDSGTTTCATGNAGARRKVLAVDDDPQTLRYVRGILTGAGYTPVMTADPQDVPRLMRKERPHLVLLDLMLPGINGIELMEEMLSTADVPVIFLSAYGQDETVARAFEKGAADYVVKPFSPTELVARIDAALRKWTPGLGRQPKPFVLDDLVIDYDERKVRVAGRTRATDRHRVRSAAGAVAQRRTGADPRAPAQTGLGPGTRYRLDCHTHRGQEATTQAWRRREKPHLYLLRTTRRLPYAGSQC